MDNCENKAHPKLYGKYYAQSDTVGGKMHYKSDRHSGKYSIWYYKPYKQWVIGKTTSLGTGRRYVKVKSSANCAYTPTYTWRYYKNGSWNDAEKTLTIWKKSFYNLHSQKISEL